MHFVKEYVPVITVWRQLYCSTVKNVKVHRILFLYNVQVESIA
jgi:hypothetical protein